MTSAEARFWAKVQPAEWNECWLWTGAGSRDDQGGNSRGGYGRFRDERHVMVRAHRWSYEHMIAPIPPGLELDHLCHTNDPFCAGRQACKHRACVNPWHCEPIPGRLNTLRGAAVRAPRTHCRAGHDLAETGTLRWDGHRNRLKCAVCVREYDRDWHRRKVAALAEPERLLLIA